MKLKNILWCTIDIARYLNAAKIGDHILVKAATDKVGKNLAFLNVQIINKQSGAILAQGSCLWVFSRQVPLLFFTLFSSCLSGSHTKYIVWTMRIFISNNYYVDIAGACISIRGLRPNFNVLQTLKRNKNNRRASHIHSIICCFRRAYGVYKFRHDLKGIK